MFLNNRLENKGIGENCENKVIRLGPKRGISDLDRPISQDFRLYPHLEYQKKISQPQRPQRIVFENINYFQVPRPYSHITHPLNQSKPYQPYLIPNFPQKINISTHPKQELPILSSRKSQKSTTTNDS